VKDLELMDIRDSADSKVIHNIMAKTKSLIEMQSRTTVADNMQQAQVAEIAAQRQVEIEKQNATQAVGLRQAERERDVGIASQQASQAIKEQERMTKEKEMAVIRAAEVAQAEIDENVNIVKAEQAKQTTILIAEETLESKKRESEGIAIQGQAVADAEKARQLAPAQPQITLAKEIGENKSYQQYLITIRKVEANQLLGIERAKALEKAQIKVFANTGEPIQGVKSVRDLFSSKGGTNIAAMLEALAQTEQGKAILDTFKPA
jgi:flotillin